MIAAERLLRLTECTVRLHEVGGAGGARGEGGYDQIAQAVIETVSAVVPCDWAAMTFAPTLLPFAQVDHSTGPGVVPMFRESERPRLDDDPIYSGRLRLLLDRPASYGEFMSDREFRSSGVYSELWAPVRTRRAMVFSTPGEFGYALVAARERGEDFTPADAVVLRGLSMHVESVMKRLFSAGDGRLRIDGREVAVQRFAWLVMDTEGTILRMSAKAGEILRKCVGAGTAAQRVPGEWRAELRRRIGGHPARPLKYLTGEGMVSVHISPIRGHAGEYTASFVIHPTAPDPLRPLVEAGLTPREVEVLGAMGEGKTNGEIGARLGISEMTAKKHVENILRKLGVPNRAAAVARLHAELARSSG